MTLGLAMVGHGIIGPFQIEMVADEGFLLAGQPLRVFRPVVQVEEHDDAEQCGRQAFEDEHPLPARQTGNAGHVVHDPAGNRAAESAGNRDPAHEHRDDPRSAGAGIPVGQVQDDAGKEAGLEDAKQETNDIKYHRAGNERHAGRQQAPDEHDPEQGQPGPDFLEDQVARHFEEKIADKEYAGAKSIYSIAETQLGFHLKLSETYIDSIEIRDDVTDEQKRNKSPRYLGINVFSVMEPVFLLRCNRRCMHSASPFLF